MMLKKLLIRTHANKKIQDRRGATDHDVGKGKQSLKPGFRRGTHRLRTAALAKL
jgi:hypothetical protein